MSEANKKSGLTKVVHNLRDAGMDRWAKITVRLTASHKYQRVQGLIAKPALLAIAVFRKRTESAMAGVLARLNMPSREDVLSLSQRMTHIEMALDDVGAGFDQFRRSTTSIARSQRSTSRDLGAEPHAVLAQEA